MHPLPCQGETQRESGTFFFNRFSDFLEKVPFPSFIEALHYKFCHQCNRLRLTSTGKIKPCLFYEEMHDLKPYLNNEKQLRLHLEKAIELKPKEHHFEEDVSYTKMNEIGG